MTQMIYVKKRYEPIYFKGCTVSHRSEKMHAIYVHIPELNKSLWIPVLAINPLSDVWDDGKYSRGTLALDKYWCKKHPSVGTGF